ncbi:WapI family immunity protein [Candidatus Neptunochlamydia vexilliferae]
MLHNTFCYRPNRRVDLRLPELNSWLEGCKEMHTSLSRKASLECMEPYLSIELEMGNGGQCELSVAITPDHCYQQHSFLFDIDQNHLKPLIDKLELILKSYPIRC